MFEIVSYLTRKRSADQQPGEPSRRRRFEHGHESESDGDQKKDRVGHIVILVPRIQLGEEDLHTEKTRQTSGHLPPAPTNKNEGNERRPGQQRQPDHNLTHDLPMPEPDLARETG